MGTDFPSRVRTVPTAPPSRRPTAGSSGIEVQERSASSSASVSAAAAAASADAAAARPRPVLAPAAAAAADAAAAETGTCDARAPAATSATCSQKEAIHCRDGAAFVRPLPRAACATPASAPAAGSHATSRTPLHSAGSARGMRRASNAPGREKSLLPTLLLPLLPFPTRPAVRMLQRRCSDGDERCAAQRRRLRASTPLGTLLPPPLRPPAATPPRPGRARASDGCRSAVAPMVFRGSSQRRLNTLGSHSSSGGDEDEACDAATISHSLLCWCFTAGSGTTGIRRSPGSSVYARSPLPLLSAAALVSTAVADATGAAAAAARLACLPSGVKQRSRTKSARPSAEPTLAATSGSVDDEEDGGEEEEVEKWRRKKEGETSFFRGTAPEARSAATTAPGAATTGTPSPSSTASRQRRSTDGAMGCPDAAAAAAETGDASSDAEVEDGDGIEVGVATPPASPPAPSTLPPLGFRSGSASSLSFLALQKRCTAASETTTPAEGVIHATFSLSFSSSSAVAGVARDSTGSVAMFA